MEKRYIAGQPIDREALLEVLRKYEIDELWVDFENPFNYVRNRRQLDYVYIIWNSQDKADKYRSEADMKIMMIFDPDWNSDDDEVVSAINLMSTYSIGLKHMMDLNKSDGRPLTKIYVKEVGLIG